VIVIVCPGQGSQTPGFLAPWVAESSFRDQLEAMSDTIGIDLVAHGTVSDADTIKDTAVAQPLIVAAGLLGLSVLVEEERIHSVGGIAGHSVGEITAAVGAGILSDTDAIEFVSVRGAAMAEAAALEPTGMSAVIGADEVELLAQLDTLGLYPANFNGAGQIVVAGALEALAALSANPPARSRVIPLQVAGAFHTRYMEPARDRLAQFAPTVTAVDPLIPIWTNRDGSLVSSGDEFVELMVGQVASPVRWDLCMDAFELAQVTGIIELAPSGALVGLAKRRLKGVPSLAIKTPDDLPAAIELIDQNS
jgi:[acyl-carrier-protein] S-malonyltransferase